MAFDFPKFTSIALNEQAHFGSIVFYGDDACPPGMVAPGPTPVSDSNFLLLEDGGYLILENGGKVVLEDATVTFHILQEGGDAILQENGSGDKIEQEVA